MEEKSEKTSGIYDKRMNIPENAEEMSVTEWDNIKATNILLPDLERWSCVCGIDYTKLTDWASVDLHFRDGDERFDISHSWMCLNSKDIPRIKAPWKEWADSGRLTLVDDVEIHPSLLTNYIQEAKRTYNIKALALDDFRFALIGKYLQEIGFDMKVNKNLKLIRPSDIMKVAPLIDSCFVNKWLRWGDAPELRWATNNAKLIRHGRKPGKEDDADMGNYVYGK